MGCENGDVEVNQRCGYGLGGGDCVFNSSVNLSLCICNHGYSHDLTQLRQRDCSLHHIVMPIFLAIFLVGSLLSVMFSLKEMSNSIGTAKQILLLNIGCGFFIIIYSVNFFLNNFIFDELGLICSYFFISFGFAAAHLIAYSLAAPLYKMAEMDDAYLVKALKLSNFFFRSIGLILAIVGIAVFGESSNPANDVGWNTIVSVMFIIFGVETAVIQLIIHVVGRKMIHAIEILIKLTPDNPNHVTTRQYIQKVQSLLRNMIFNAPAFISSWILPSLIYLVIGYFPCFFIVLITTYISGVLFQFGVAFYARRERLNQPKDDPKVLSANVDINQQQTNNNHNFLSAYKSSEDEYDSKYQGSEID